MSVRNYNCSLRNNPKERCSQLLYGGYLKSPTISSPIILAFLFPSISPLFKTVSWNVVRSEILGTVLLKIPVFWDVTPCRWSSSSKLFHFCSEPSSPTLFDARTLRLDREDEGVKILLNVEKKLAQRQSATCQKTWLWYFSFNTKKKEQTTFSPFVAQRNHSATAVWPVQQMRGFNESEREGEGGQIPTKVGPPVAETQQ
jgi:hypothetical protein